MTPQNTGHAWKSFNNFTICLACGCTLGEEASIGMCQKHPLSLAKATATDAAAVTEPGATLLVVSGQPDPAFRLRGQEAAALRPYRCHKVVHAAAYGTAACSFALSKPGI
jgi:hypothetical protein